MSSSVQQELQTPAHLAHLRRKRWLMFLMPLLAATEFVESGSFVFASGRIAEGMASQGQMFAGVLAAFLTGSLVAIALQHRFVAWLGYRRYLSWALALFHLGALGAMLSHGFAPLVVSRLAQGLGGGALFTSGRILIVLLFSAGDRVEAVRRFIRVLFGLSALGPLLATLLLQLGDWHAVFAAPLPLAMLSWIGVRQLLPAHVGQESQRVNLPLVLLPLLILGIGVLQLGLSEARSWAEWGGPHVLALTLLGAVLLAVFHYQHQRHPTPLFLWHRLHHPGFATGLLLYGLYYFIANANAYLLPSFADHVVGFSSVAIGALSTASAVVTWLSAKAYIRFGSKVSEKRTLMASAALLMALALAGLAVFECGVLQAGAATSWQALVAFIAVLVTKGVFTALFVLPLAGLTFRELGDAHFGAGYQAKNMLRHITISLGTAWAAYQLSAMGLGATVSTLYGSTFGLLAFTCALLGIFVQLQKRLR